MKNKSQIKKGFTLIEILVSSAILVILASGFLGLQYIVSQNQTTAWKNYTSVEDANNVITAITRELRNLREADNGVYAIDTTGDQEIIFYSDTDYDGDVEKVRYTLTGTQFTRGVIEPTGIPISYPAENEVSKELSENIRNNTEPVFYYYNSDWPTDTVNNPLPEASRNAETRVVEISLRSNTKPDDSDSDYILKTSVQLRMLKDN